MGIYENCLLRTKNKMIFVLCKTRRKKKSADKQLQGTCVSVCMCVEKTARKIRQFIVPKIFSKYNFRITNSIFLSWKKGKKEIGIFREK